MNYIVTYIEHSCFLVETTECYLLFDYYCGEVSLPALNPAKPLLLFNSHAHHDHFSKEIFALRDRYPSALFVLSADIPVPAAIQPFTCPMLPHEHRLIQLAGGRAAVSVASADALNADALSADALSADALSDDAPNNDALSADALNADALSDDAPNNDAPNNGALSADALNTDAMNADAPTTDVSIETLRSNDEGVAFIVRLGDLSIYHAGDLNNWWWDGDVEDQKLADIYHEELERIRGRHFTTAFIPLDPRLQGWWKGIEDFMHYADADRIFPMHNFGEKGLPKKFLALDCAASYKNRVFDVEEPLSSWKL